MPSLLLALLLAVPPPPSLPQVEVDDCGVEPPGFVPPPPLPPRPHERALGPEAPPAVRRGETGGPQRFSLGLPQGRERGGALRGKTVYLSPGHGFYDSPPLGRWATQRPTTHALVEDLVSAEALALTLAPMLEGAGARVVSLREGDPQPNLVTVDDLERGYTEEGPPELFATATDPGWGTPPAVLTDAVSPFLLGRVRELEVRATPTAQAVWAPTIPADGHYSVSIAFGASARNVPDAHFVVRHAGGETHFRVDQRRHPGTWVGLGRFFFRKGTDPARAAVVALNDSAASEGAVSLDAVRFGGGMGLMDRGRGTSRRPRVEECARYHAQYQGAPSTVWATQSTDRTSDVSARPRLAAWDHEEGEDAVYVAWHTNASNGTLRGTTTYVYGAKDDARIENGTFEGVPGSDVLARAIHGELVADARAGWDAAWADLGVRVKHLGEVNPAHNPEMPSVLVEVAFHDALQDADALREPDFRVVAARAIAQGIIKYFAARDGQVPVLPPETPVAVLARNLGAGQVEVRWRAADAGAPGLGGDAPASYVVYQSEDGAGWDEGTVVVDGTRLALTLAPGTARFFRVAAVNAGGESLPSDVVGVATPQEGAGVPALVVNGFDRLDATMRQQELLACFGLDRVDRLPLDRMNDGSYVRRHGEALVAQGLGFDSAGRAAVLRGDVALSDYALVDWMVGRGVHEGGALGEDERRLLRAHVEGGRALLLSGANVASALASGGPDAQAFLAEVLQAALGSGQVARRVDGAADGPLAALKGLLLDDGSLGAYAVGVPDVLEPAGGVVLARFERTGAGAAVRSTGTSRVALLGFPFEALVSGDSRRAVMAALLADLGALATPAPVDGNEPEPAYDPDAPVVDACGLPTLPPGAPTVVLPDRPVALSAVRPPRGCGCGTPSGEWPAAVLLLLVTVGRRRRRISPSPRR